MVPFDLGVPVQVFGYARPDAGAVRYRATVCGERAGPVTTSGGFALHTTHGLRALARADTVVVPGVDDTDRPIGTPVLRALQRAHARGARIASICTGAFVLAEAGLLDGRIATTHWLDAPALAARYPAATVDPNVLYVDNGSVLTSAGIASAIDVCLHMVQCDHGAEVANVVARRMVVAPHRSGGQAQFIADPVPSPAGRVLESTRAWAARQLHRPLSVGDLAEHAGMSERTLARRFREETGTTPVQWLLRQRVLKAQRELETTRVSIERIASRCGFGTAVSMRAHFRQRLGTSPQAYRRAFRGDLSG